MGEGLSGMRRSSFAAWVGIAVGVCLLQSIVHLGVVLGEGRVGSLLDLDRSNGIPDLLSTLALGIATAGAFMLAYREREGHRALHSLLTGTLAVLTLADAVHDGPHPSSGVGWLVILVVVAAVILTVLVMEKSHPRTRITLGVAAAFLAASFLVNGLDRVDGWFERVRADPVVEYQIVAKEGFELLGWSLVALAIWNEVARRRTLQRQGTSEVLGARAA